MSLQRTLFRARLRREYGRGWRWQWSERHGAWRRPRHWNLGNGTWVRKPPRWVYDSAAGEGGPALCLGNTSRGAWVRKALARAAGRLVSIAAGTWVRKL